MSSSTDDVLSCICRKLRDVERLMLDQSDYSTCKTLLDECNRNLQRVRDVLPRHVVEEMNTSISGLLTICNTTAPTEDGSECIGRSYRAIRKKTGNKGRPAVDITTEQLTLFHSKGFTARKMASLCKCSTQLIYKRLYAANIRQRDKYTAITDGELKEKVEQLHTSFPNSGGKMMAGYLKAEGITSQRHRVREALIATDPVGTATRWGKTVSRRVYRVSMPNSLWHMDSHMKLIRWGFATHGCVDGYSRTIVFLHCCTANTADVVATSFLAACDKYGLPQRVRVDCGLENFHVGVLMNVLQGQNRGSIITGTSVHNQRIERLWRDVFKEVVSTFYNEFYGLEDSGLLDADDRVHRCALQMTYLPLINSRLAAFQQAWNSHSIRTEGQQTPQQLWLTGMLLNANSSVTDDVFCVDSESVPQRVLNYFASLPDDATAGITVSSTPQLSSWQSEMNLSAQELHDVQDAMSTSDVKCTQYLQCVAKLKEIVSEPD